MSTMWKVLIVDDEKPARVRVRDLLAERTDLIVSECASGVDALTVIDSFAPDLLFLDVQMPELDGFALLRQLAPDRMPVTIFITAYDRYAVRAFEAHALDYLTKPFTDERFELALSRAMAHLQLRHRDELARRMIALLNEGDAGVSMGVAATAAAHQGSGAAATPALDRLVVRCGQRVLFLRPEEVDWVEAAGVYVYLHVGEDKYLHRISLTALESRLASAGFVRIHRSALVNFERIRELSPRNHGEFGVTLRDGRRLRLTRNFRARLEERLGHPL